MAKVAQPKHQYLPTGLCSRCKSELARSVDFCPYCSQPNPSIVHLVQPSRLTPSVQLSLKAAPSFGGASYNDLSGLCDALAGNWSGAKKFVSRGDFKQWLEHH